MRTRYWRRWLKQNLDQVLAYSKFIISSIDCQQIIATIVTIAVTIKDDNHDSIKAITTVNSANGYFRHRCPQQLLWFLPSPIFKRESSIWRWLVLVYSHPLCSALSLSYIKNVFWLQCKVNANLQVFTNRHFVWQVIAGSPGWCLDHNPT